MAKSTVKKSVKKKKPEKVLVLQGVSEEDRGEIRIMFDKEDETYKRIIANAKKEERSPAKEIKVFLTRNY